MAAGQQYNKHLNYDQAFVKTPAVYMSTLNEWVMLYANGMELFGATVATRPAATDVPVGATFMAVDSLEVWMSNGTDWKVI